jgi:hypothetical protein
LEYRHYQLIECKNRNSHKDQSKRDLENTPDLGATGTIKPTKLELKSNPNHRFAVICYNNNSIRAENSRSTLENR